MTNFCHAFVLTPSVFKKNLLVKIFLKECIVCLYVFELHKNEKEACLIKSTVVMIIV